MLGGTLVLTILEIIALLVTTAFAIMWVRDASGNYEPWTVICGVLTGGIEVYRRIRARSEGSSKRTSRLEELIRWIQDQGVEKPLSQVLPRALQLSQLLGDHDLEHWVRMELYGYTQEGGMTEKDAVPEYREVTGRYMDEHNRMLHIENPALHFVNGYRFRYGVRQLEELASKGNMQNIRDEDCIELLRRELHVDVFRFCFSPTELVGVLDRIRNRLLERIRQIGLDRKALDHNKPAKTAPRKGVGRV